jgi:hypothetical protein
MLGGRGHGMIFFYGEGRLGNQIFQYQALSRISTAAESVLAVGLEQLPIVGRLKGPRVKIVTRKLAVKRFIKYVILPFVMRPLGKTFRLFNYAHEGQHENPPHSGASGELIKRKGLIGSFTFVDGGFYQNPSYSEKIFPIDTLELTAELRTAAQNYIRSQCPAGCRPMFVHVRRGDYLNYATYGLSNLDLPLRYFREAIQTAQERFVDLHLIFVTDDPLWVERNFNDIPAKSIASFDPATDFAILTECRGGIIANSTFSLAAALMMKSPDLIIGPLYWFGFRIGAWYPPRIRCSHESMMYLAVNEQ